MSAGEPLNGNCRGGREERDQQAGPYDDGAGKSAVIPPDLAAERTLIIDRADAEALLLARFGWSVRGSSPFGGADPPADDPPEEKDSRS